MKQLNEIKWVLNPVDLIIKMHVGSRHYGFEASSPRPWAIFGESAETTAEWMSRRKILTSGSLIESSLTVYWSLSGSLIDCSIKPCWNIINDSWPTRKIFLPLGLGRGSPRMDRNWLTQLNVFNCAALNGLVRGEPHGSLSARARALGKTSGKVHLHLDWIAELQSSSSYHVVSCKTSSSVT